MKRLCLLPLLFLAACGEPTADKATLVAVEAEQRRALEADGAIECAVAGQPLRRECAVERTDGREGLLLTLRHPDGSFRRLLVTRDGRGVIAADGAEPAKVAILAADRIEVSIGGARYRLPATVKPRDPAR